MPVKVNAEIISKEQSDAIKGEYVYEHTAFIPFEKNNQDNITHIDLSKIWFINQTVPKIYRVS